MQLGIKLNLDVLLAQTWTDDIEINFNNISNLTNWNETGFCPSEQVGKIEFLTSNNRLIFNVYTSNPVEQPQYELDDTDLTSVSATSNYIIFKCEIANNEVETLLALINLNVIELDQFGMTSIVAYRNNSERNKVTKSLILVTIFEGQFNTPLGIKNIELTVEGYKLEDIYNYVYIPKLKRYYYVDTPIMMTSTLTRIPLKEDVLMSWASLIKQQTAFVDRCANSSYYNLDIEDSEIKTDYDKNINITNILTSTASSLYQEISSPYILTVVRK